MRLLSQCRTSGDEGHLFRCKHSHRQNRWRTVVDGQTQNFQGFFSDMPGIILKHTSPYGYRLSVEHLLMKVTCLAVSTDPSTKEVAHYD